MLCPSCSYDNIDGVDQCEQCGTSLMQEDTNPENRMDSNHIRIITDPIRKANLQEVAIVHPTTTIYEALKKMKDLSQDCALVVDRGEVAGIFTERDVLKKVKTPEMDLEEIEIHLLMTILPEVLDENDSISFAMNKMAMGNFRHVPVKKTNGTFTVFSVKDALNYLF
ncbi:MAG: CBS domain-containing protein [Bdellovibrionales bacterium]|nr:CBS domain-containing protein [Bdellovibrionales bacterium]